MLPLNFSVLDGIVIKSTGSWYLVRTHEEKIYQARLKGKFRIKGIKATNPVVVGDKVSISFNDDGTATINDIQPRNNYIVRKATKLSKRSHIIAANIDQAFLIVTLAKPRTSTGFIDRFLITSEAYHIPSCIVFNKIDIYDFKMLSLMEELESVYSAVGYQCFKVSALRGDNIENLFKSMKNRTTLFSGHSGVGKSHLINAMIPGLNLKTQNISNVHLKGVHTTTFAEMFALPQGGYIIDTPGIKEFGLYDFKPAEISERYPEMRALLHDCKYYNCTHVHEPGCAVKNAVKEGDIAKSRYLNYLKILQDDNLI